MKKVSIVIPAYNEEKTIEKILKKILDVKLPLEKEIIIVNDGSTDKTKDIVEEFIKKHPNENIKLINKENGGKGSALKVGIKHSTGDIIIIQDADLEYDPNDYPKLIKPILEGKTKVVYGSRLRKRNKFSHISFLLGGLLITTLTNLLYFTFLTDEPTCYKVFHKDLKDILINAEGNKFDWEPEVTAKILRKGYKIYEVPINYYPRTKKEGKKIRWKDGLEAVYTLIKWRFKKI
ncbi:glycosyltransferase family 2 protein [Methanocaldococcus indicus]|uniref:glycosyltransferase family 2 protein n=1 Tax=Methanocaldococcus indicus TaxID=213231 RepID=UPI003C6D00AC